MATQTFLNLPETKRQRILDAAIDAFGRAPYAEVHLSRVAEAAGIAKGSLYQYFADKADLYRWLLTVHLPEAKLAALDAAGDPADGTIWELLERAFLAGVRFAAAAPALTRLALRFHRESGAVPGVAAIRANHREAAHAWLLGLLGAAQARGELAPCVDLETAATLLAHALGEGAVDLLARHLGHDPDAIYSDPERLQGLTDAELLGLARAVTALFRDGMARQPREQAR